MAPLSYADLADDANAFGWESWAGVEARDLDGLHMLYKYMVAGGRARLRVRAPGPGCYTVGPAAIWSGERTPEPRWTGRSLRVNIKLMRPACET